MPSLTEAFPEIVAALDDLPRTSNDAPPPAGPVAFEAVAAVLLARAVEARALPRALDALRDAGLLEAGAFAGADPVEFEDAFGEARVRVGPKTIGPAQKVARKWLDGVFEDREASTESLRSALLGINGVGPATADAILLFALGRAAFPVDRATYRILVRHGWLDASSDYDEARSVVERQADEPATLGLVAAGFEQLGRSHCRPTVAKCAKCVLRPFLPESGPIEPGE